MQRARNLQRKKDEIQIVLQLSFRYLCDFFAVGCLMVRARCKYANWLAFLSAGLRLNPAAGLG